MLLYVFDMFHILLSADSLRELWNVCVCVYIYIYACVRVCVCVYVCMLANCGMSLGTYFMI